MYSNFRSQEQYVDHLPFEEKNSINWYTGGNYDEFNEALRTGKILSQIQRNNMENIDSAFDSVPPLESSIVVYKGKGTERVYSDKAFMSTTLVYERAKRFSGKECCILQITVSAGSKVLPIRTISKEPDEEEVLLDRNGIMVVTGNTIRKEDMMKIIFVTYCPKDSRPVHSDEEIKKADKKFDSKLIVEMLIDSMKNDDIDFLDEDIIKISYSKVTGGKSISEPDLELIKKRLGIN